MGGGRVNILAIDTSGPVAGCAVMMDGKIVHLAAMNHGLTHSESIMPAVDAALAACGLRCADVDAFAAVAGPGSFTGVRIGVCAAKGMAHAAGKPCVAVDALEALAMNFYGFDGLCCPILDARRGQVYCAAFDMREGQPRRVLPDDAIALEDFIARLPGDRRLAFAGDGVPVHVDSVRAALGGRALIAPANLRDIRADAACLLAAARPETWVEAWRLRPIYLRAPQAERERRKREGRA